ncbi:hypothetical protein J8273_7032 [Carpediemonas membranifera]|uniref:Uncharacterized protein n=1 Tax=Carpediemonas membranifera TaxID=201153 RepID=A0A8J6B189_9EUKA|nr:hypothetical protein J8273_7032 [Carpediemonas membranifera]|eukprot:KAG9390779.1 hypothetical protein J8273_7032 [Carpediemonas membranifera]
MGTELLLNLDEGSNAHSGAILKKKAMSVNQRALLRRRMKLKAKAAQATAAAEYEEGNGEDDYYNQGYQNGGQEFGVEAKYDQTGLQLQREKKHAKKRVTVPTDERVATEGEGCVWDNQVPLEYVQEMEPTKPCKNATIRVNNIVVGATEKDVTTILKAHSCNVVSVRLTQDQDRKGRHSQSAYVRVHDGCVLSKVIEGTHKLRLYAKPDEDGKTEDARRIIVEEDDQDARTLVVANIKWRDDQELQSSTDGQPSENDRAVETEIMEIKNIIREGAERAKRCKVKGIRVHKGARRTRIYVELESAAKAPRVCQNIARGLKESELTGAMVSLLRDYTDQSAQHSREQSRSATARPSVREKQEKKVYEKVDLSWDHSGYKDHSIPKHEYAEEEEDRPRFMGGGRRGGFSSGGGYDRRGGRGRQWGSRR